MIGSSVEPRAHRLSGILGNRDSLTAGDTARAAPTWQRELGAAGEGALSVAMRRIIRWTAVVWDLIWLIGIAVSLATQADSLRVVWISWVLLAIASGVWILGPVVGRLPINWFVGLTAFTALGQVINTDPQALQGAYLAAIAWLNLAGIMGAYLLRDGRGPRFVLGIAVAAETLILILAWSEGILPDVWRGCIMLAWYAVGNGMAVATAVVAINHIAGAEDEAAEQRARAQTAAEAARVHRDESFNVSRLLHDTAVNTLGAIAAGVSATHSALIRQRCASDLAALQSACSAGDPAPGIGPVPVTATLLAAARKRAELLGLRLREHVDQAEIHVPDQVAAALAACVDEALLNVAKHAGVDEVQLSLAARDGGLLVTVRDLGRGCVTPARAGGGIAESISARAKIAGIRAGVTSQLGGGTTVKLVWAPVVPVELPVSEDPGNSALRMLPSGGARTAVWLTLLALVATLLSMEQIPVLWTSLSVGVAAAGAVMLIYLSRRFGTVPSWACALAVIAGAFTAYVPGWGAVGCERVGTAWWGGDAGLLILIVMGLLIDRIAWVVAAGLVHIAAVVALLYQTGPCSGQTVVVTVINIGVLVGPVVIRQLARRFGDEAERSRRAAAQAWARAGALQAQERVRDVRARAATGVAGPLLASLAAGELDAADPQTRARCAEVERYLRSTMQVDPDLGELGDVIVQGVEAAHRRGAALLVRSAEAIPVPEPAVINAVGGVIAHVVEVCQPGESAVISLFPTDSGGAMTIVLNRDALPDGWPQVPDDAPGLRHSTASIGDQTLIELSWVAERSEGTTNSTAIIVETSGRPSAGILHDDGRRGGVVPAAAVIDRGLVVRGVQRR